MTENRLEAVILFDNLIPDLYNEKRVFTMENFFHKDFPSDVWGG